MKKKWIAYKADPGAAKWIVSLRKLGEVMAAHQPEALRLAWDKWPSEIDGHQVQGGFTVRPAKGRNALSI